MEGQEVVVEQLQWELEFTRLQLTHTQEENRRLKARLEELEHLLRPSVIVTPQTEEAVAGPSLSMAMIKNEVETQKKHFLCSDCGETFENVPLRLQHRQFRHGVRTGPKTKIKRVHVWPNKESYLAHTRDIPTPPRGQRQDPPTAQMNYGRLLDEDTDTGEDESDSTTEEQRKSRNTQTARPRLLQRGRPKKLRTARHQKKLQTVPQRKLQTSRQRKLRRTAHQRKLQTVGPRRRTNKIITGRRPGRPRKQPTGSMLINRRKRANLNNEDTPRKTKFTFSQVSCLFCDKVFQHSTSLGIHINSHTKERPYFCRECPSEFSQLSSLNRHLQAHEKQRQRAEAIKSVVELSLSQPEIPKEKEKENVVVILTDETLQYSVPNPTDTPIITSNLTDIPTATSNPTDTPITTSKPTVTPITTSNPTDTTITTTLD